MVTTRYYLSSKFNAAFEFELEGLGDIKDEWVLPNCNYPSKFASSGKELLSFVCEWGGRVAGGLGRLTWDAL
ncbi:unnamed protein product [Pieris macdunnoughi]|uniref:Uncharacterized protein n=1 Tax=Pieris macdunnoughi TaxID=345717 RepID=A0A821T5V4_9NEOP|nr:unnamed protein product [Pieris macdunnoughi]